jgi:hypothetical protein
VKQHPGLALTAQQLTQVRHSVGSRY